MSVHLGLWDFLLIAGVSAMATTLAYLHHPRWKALIMSLPIPFTLATLSLGRPVDATNALGLAVLLGYAHAVRVLYGRLRVPIVAAIAFSVLGYCALGTAAAPAIPASDGAFWVAEGLVFALGLALYITTPHREEPGHRSPLPVYVKLPIVVAVVVALIAIKKSLQGFMTLFPMVSVMAAYEARFSLWTICLQIPVLMLTMVPMMAAIRLAQPRLGLGGALAVGWLVFLALLVPITRRLWKSAGWAASKTA